MTSTKDTNLPKGWVHAKVEDLFEVKGGGTPSTSKSEYWNGNIPWITSADIFDLKKVIPRKYINQKAISNSTTNIVPKNSLIVVTRVGLGKIAIAPYDICFSQDSQGLICRNKAIYSEYALYYLSKAVQIFKHDNRGTTISGVTKKQLKELPFPLPPFPEQKRIVAKIEELFTKLDAGVEVLKKVKAELKRYRQAVLKYAFEGKLTAEWREKNQGKIEPASKLLERIEKEREKNSKGKVKKLPPLDTSNLPELPEGWEWISLSTASEHVVDCLHSTPKFSTDGKYCIDTTCIEPGRIVFDRARFVSDKIYQERVRRLVPAFGDILFAREGTIGTATVVPEKVELCLGQRMMMFRSIKDMYSSYFMYALLSPIFVNQYKPRITGTTAPHVNIRDLITMGIPLCSISEQKIIVSEIERHFSIADEVELTIENSLKEAERLRQSILKKAFEGKLVPQDLKDEPAEMLLERIRAEKISGLVFAKASTRRAKNTAEGGCATKARTCTDEHGRTRTKKKRR